jgi:hypothetical protein
MRRVSQCAILALISLCASIGWGQATISLRGMVTDPSGPAIRDAKATLVSSTTSFNRETQAQRSPGGES